MERFLVTGASGCIGSWVVHLLHEQETPVVALDLRRDLQRLRLLMSDEEAETLPFREVDVTDAERVAEVVTAEEITHVIHLAALQVPFCVADPVRGAQVNVVGTVNVFEGARHAGVRGLTYASSIAVFGPPELYPNGEARDDSPAFPRTLYGAYKQANEATAAVYARDWSVGSIGLRPSVVYGPGRDQGLTSDPTKALLAAIVGVPSHIGFGGSMVAQHAEDVARAFIAAARAEADGALVHNLGGPTVTVGEVIAAIESAVPEAKGTITYEDVPLPLPARVDGSGLSKLLVGIEFRSLEEGIEDATRHFRRLIAEGLIPQEVRSVG